MSLTPGSLQTNLFTIYRVSHSLLQFPGNWLQIANYDRYSNFEGIFGMPCLFKTKKSTRNKHIFPRKGCPNYSFSKQPIKLLPLVFCNSIFGGRLEIDCLSTFFSQYYFVLIILYMLKRQGISKMALELAYLG